MCEVSRGSRVDREMVLGSRVVEWWWWWDRLGAAILLRQQRISARDVDVSKIWRVAQSSVQEGGRRLCFAHIYVGDVEEHYNAFDFFLYHSNISLRGVSAHGKLTIGATAILSLRQFTSLLSSKRSSSSSSNACFDKYSAYMFRRCES